MKNFLEKRKSSIHGFGIFTTKNINKGEVFYTVPLDHIVNENHRSYAYMGNGQYVNDDKVLNWVNHSCEPNTFLNIKQKPPTLVAIKDMSIGEEITCDYSNEMDGFKFKCNCAKSGCKKIIGKKFK